MEWTELPVFPAQGELGSVHGIPRCFTPQGRSRRHPFKLICCQDVSA